MNVRGDNTILHISRILKNYSQRNMDTKKSFDSTRISSMGQRIKKKKKNHLLIARNILKFKNKVIYNIIIS